MAADLQHDAILAAEAPGAPSVPGLPGVIRALGETLFRISALMILVGGLVLTFGVVTGHILGQALVWQDEVTIFLVAGAIFLSAAFVQSQRGHVGIEVLASVLPPGINRARHLIVDAVVLAFTVFFAWKARGLLWEAWSEEQISHSAWGPPLWIPYALLTLGMAVLAVQVALQVGERSLLTLGTVLIAVLAFILWQRPPAPLLTGIPQPVIGVAFCAATLIVMFSGM